MCAIEAMICATIATAPQTASAAGDELVGSGVALGVGGGVSALVGVVVLAKARPPTEYCDVGGGCYYEVHTDKSLGYALVGGGVSLAAFGVPMALVRGAESGTHEDVGAMQAGAWLTALGTSSVVAGIGGLVGPEKRLEGEGALLVVGGGVLAAVGLPMWIGGAASVEGATRPRSVVTRSIGIGLTIVGSLTAAAGVVMIAASAGHGDSDGQQIGRAIGYLLLGSGGVANAVGIPLWVAGDADRPRLTTTTASSLPPSLPRIAIGPRSFSLAWSF